MNEVDITVTDLSKNHSDKPACKGFYSLPKHVYQEDGEVVTESIALDKGNLEILRDKIRAILIDELPPEKKSEFKPGPIKLG